MITWKEYQRKPLSYWKKVKVKTLRELRNGNFVIPQGTIMEITNKWKGFSLKKIDTCPHCNIGRIVSISAVEPMALQELIEEKE